MSDDQRLPATAFPFASYAEHQTLTPDRVKADNTEGAFLLYLGGLIIGTPRTADDTRLQAGMRIAHEISRAAERHGAAMRAELELRQRDRQAAGAAPPERPHPYANGHPLAPVDTETCLTLALPDAPEVPDAAE